MKGWEGKCYQYALVRYQKQNKLTTSYHGTSHNNFSMGGVMLVKKNGFFREEAIVICFSLYISCFAENNI